MKIEAERLRKYYTGLTVEIDRRFPVVSITCDGCEGVFLQGHEAENFVSECDTLSEKYPNVNYADIEVYVASDYASLFDGV